MNEPIIPIDAIARDARRALAARERASACPYPMESAAEARWLTEYQECATAQGATSQ